VKKGDIVIIPFPFTDLSGQKNRPALVLIKTDTDITVAFITTQIKWQDEHDFRLEPSAENGLKRTSLVRLSKLATIDNELIIGKLGNLIETEIQQLNKNLVKLFQLDK